VTLNAREISLLLNILDRVNLHADPDTGGYSVNFAGSLTEEEMHAIHHIIIKLEVENEILHAG
jgi:hypothetical protein